MLKNPCKILWTVSGAVTLIAMMHVQNWHFRTPSQKTEGPAWQRTPDFLHDLQEERKPSVEVNFKAARKASAGPVTLKEYQKAISSYVGIAPIEFFDKWRDVLVGTDRSFAFAEIAAISDDEYSDRLSDLLKQYFSKKSKPTDEDDLLEFDMLKMNSP